MNNQKLNTIIVALSALNQLKPQTQELKAAQIKLEQHLAKQIETELKEQSNG